MRAENSSRTMDDLILTMRTETSSSTIDDLILRSIAKRCVSKDEAQPAMPERAEPDGQITPKFLSIPETKNISLLTARKSATYAPRPVPLRGVSRSSRTLVRDAVDACCADDERHGRRTAKSCGPDAPTLVSSFAEVIPLDDGGKQARSPGRARRKPLKPLRGECRVISGVTVVTMLVWFFIFHARLRAHRAPGIPCALLISGGQESPGKTRANCAARSRSRACMRRAV
jgi:hypothetical protein